MNPDIWSVLISVFALAAMGYYAWRRRSVPGALPFAYACLFTGLWGAGLIFQMSVGDPASRFAWLKFQMIWLIPGATAIFCFVLDYAMPGRWLTRRNLLLLSIPSVLFVVLLATDGAHHFFTPVSPIKLNPIIPGLLVGFYTLLGLLNLVVFTWLFIRSPQHRWPVTLMVIGQVAGRMAIIWAILQTDYENLVPFLFIIFPYGMYAIALFRFHIFDPVPLARQVVLEQMQEGMLVLDLEGKIADLNPMAESILGQPAAQLRGTAVADVLTGYPNPAARSDGNLSDCTEIDLTTGSQPRTYNLQLSPLKDRRGVALGQLLLLHDFTEQKQAQDLLLEQQRVLATLEERERLARELHDSIGQVLGFVSLQAQAIRRRAQDGDLAEVDAQLSRLAEVAQAAHADVRESILSLQFGAKDEWSFLSLLQQYLNAYYENYGMETELVLPPGMDDRVFEPSTEVQLLRVIQEALTNARTHGHARRVQVVFELHPGMVQILVSDDGSGFDPGALPGISPHHYGLAFMQERLADVGGSLEIESQPGSGTRLRLKIPLPENQSENPS